MKKNIATILIFSLVLSILNFTKVFANEEQYEDFKSTVTTNDRLKTWTIKFNGAINQNYNNLNNFKVVDDKGVEFPIEVALAIDNSSVKLVPKQEYELNKVYKILISKNLKSNKNKFLKKGKQLSFVVKEGEISNPIGKDILNINDEQNIYFTQVTVRASQRTYKIKINNEEANYYGNNIYKLRSLYIKSGECVKVEAFDKNDSLIEVKEYIVK